MRIVKYLFVWIKRYNELNKKYGKLYEEYQWEKSKLYIARERYHHSIEHNVILAKEIDNLNKYFKANS